MVTSFPLQVLLGSVFGFLAGLGVGGGSLLILWLTLVLGTAYDTARIINLSFFLPTAFVASCFRWKQGTLNLYKVLPGILSGCLCAALFSPLSQHLPTDMLQKMFGALLLLIGCKELLYKTKN